MSAWTPPSSSPPASSLFSVVGSAVFSATSATRKLVSRLLRLAIASDASCFAPLAASGLGAASIALTCFSAEGWGSCDPIAARAMGASVTGSVTTRRSLVYLPTLLDPALDAAHPREHRGHRRRVAPGAWERGRCSARSSRFPLAPGSAVFFINRSFRSGQKKKTREALRVEIAHKNEGGERNSKSPSPGGTKPTRNSLSEHEWPYLYGMKTIEESS